MRNPVLTHAAISLSLILVACAPQAPVPVPALALSAPRRGGETVSFHLRRSSSFAKKSVDPGTLTYIRLSLVGSGISGTIDNDAVNGVQYIPVTGGSATVTISNVPASAGKLRVVTLRGYDVDHNPLPAFVGKGFYLSSGQSGQHEITANRRRLLTGLALEQLLQSHPSRIAALDPEAIQNAVDLATGYSAGSDSFDSDPTLFDAAALAQLLLGTASPTASEIHAAARLIKGRVSIELATLGGSAFDEAVTVVVNDPHSVPKTLAAGISSPTRLSLDVAIGSWTLEARKADGTVLGSTDVQVTTDSRVSLGSQRLTLDVREVPVPDGEVLINPVTTGLQAASDVAMAADGSYVVVWRDESGGPGGDIMAQRFDSSGSRQDEALTINSTVRGGYHPSVALDGAGNMFVSWSASGDEDDAGTDIYGRYVSAGSTSGTEFRVNTYTTDNQLHPDVAMDSSGDFVVVWESGYQDGDDTGIYGRYFSAGSLTGSSEFRANDVTSSRQSDPVVAIDAAGDFVVAWQSNGQDGSGYGVFARHFSAGAAPDGNEFQANVDTFDYQGMPALAMDTDGDFLLAWDSNYTLYARHYSAGSTAGGSEFRVSNLTTGRERMADVAMDSDGDFVVTWQSEGQDGSGYGIFGNRYVSGSTVASSEFQVNVFTGSDQMDSHVALNDAGDFIVTWNTRYGHPLDSYGAVIGRFFRQAGTEP